MSQIVRYLLLCSILLMVSACNGMPKLFWDTDEGRYESDIASTPPSSPGTEPPTLSDDIAPELHANRQLPMAGDIGITASAGKLPEKYRQLLASQTPALDTRIYGQTIAKVFSAAVDAMTSLNIPVESVDSPNGVVISDWVRKGENNLTMPSIKSYTRHRFIVYIYRTGRKSGGITGMEVRVLGQIFHNRHWINSPIKRKLSEELFTAVDEQLVRMKATALPLEIAN
jgi:hypothetical protein